MEYRLKNGELEFIFEGDRALRPDECYLHTWNLSPMPDKEDVLVCGRRRYKVVRRHETLAAPKHPRYPFTLVVQPLPAEADILEIE